MSAGDRSDALVTRRVPWIGAVSVALAVALVAGCARYPYPQAVTGAGASTSQRSSQAHAQPRVNPGLLKRAKAPSCDVADAGKDASVNTPAATADPNLVEIARLQLERDCFKTAELNVRRRLNKLQSSVAPRR